MKKIGLQDYLLKKQIQETEKPIYRQFCTSCFNPDFSCYCASIEMFDPNVQFVILIHPIEFQRRIATGRMSHLILKNSLLIRGHDFSKDYKVNSILNSSDHQCVILYPSLSSINLSYQKMAFDKNKNLVVFVIDGTWATARQMMRQSQNLQSVPRVCFTPQTKSNFRVRKQPQPNCLSTIEAIHHFIELTSDQTNFDSSSRQHDILLRAFNTMVERQINYAKKFS